MFVRGPGSVGIPDVVRSRLRRALSPGCWAFSECWFCFPWSSQVGFFCCRPLLFVSRLAFPSKPDDSRRLGFAVLLLVLLVCLVQIEAGEAEVSSRYWFHSQHQFEGINM